MNYRPCGIGCAQSDHSHIAMNKKLAAIFNTGYQGIQYSGGYIVRFNCPTNAKRTEKRA